MFPSEDARYRYDPNHPHRNHFDKGQEITMDFLPMDSTAILAAGYDADNCVMGVQFIASLMDGKVYFFRSVPKSVWDAFLEAPSKGRFFQEHIRSNIGPPVDGGYEWCSGHRKMD